MQSCLVCLPGRYYFTMFACWYLPKQFAIISRFVGRTYLITLVQILDHHVIIPFKLFYRYLLCKNNTVEGTKPLPTTNPRWTLPDGHIDTKFQTQKVFEIRSLWSLP
uniref:Uncharacterized protein n=1 Tax=Cacopsylla melanoneura TaxID=428564 RepID=A0A8D8L7G1_9HEMI